MFNLKHKFMAVALLASTFIPQGHAAMTDDQLGLAMRNDIKKYMTTLKSQKIIFHWVDASDINPAGQYNTQYPSTAAHFKTYVEKQGRRIYNRRSAGDGDIEGPGLYMASDALISRAYGGEKSFGLIVGVLKPGARILPSYGGLAINAAISAEITKRGCAESRDYLGLLDTFDATCTKVKQLMVGKDASFAEGRIYSWGSESVTGCSGRNSTRDVVVPTGISSGSISGLETFVVYNPNLFSNIFGYTHKTTASGNAMADQVLSYLKGIQQMGTYANLISAKQMTDATIKAMTPAEVANFSRKYIVGCVP